MAPLRLIHVGVGVRGRHWLDVVAGHAGFESVACVDPSPAMLDEARRLPGQGHGCFVPSLPEALAATRADAVLIASPTALHTPQAIAALDAGLAVLVEKPLGVSVGEAAAVVARSRATGRPVVVAENYRFFAAERTVRHVIADGRLGRVSSAMCVDRRDQPSHTQGAWVKGAEHSFLAEIAVHHFDSFRYLFGRQPRSLFAASFNPRGSTYDAGAAVEALIELDGGLPIQYAGTLVATRYEFSLWIEGEHGDLWTDRTRVGWRPKGERTYRPVPLVAVPAGDERPYPRAGTRALLDQFRDAAMNGVEAETRAADNLWTLAMVDGSVLSSREGRRVAIDEIVTPDLLRTCEA
ncbi:MAG: Gfo/Idh/MocA family oxidoreductase [Vicinamibacterales bacterium]